MYASQKKRLCVRGTSSEETRDLPQTSPSSSQEATGSTKQELFQPQQSDISYSHRLKFSHQRLEHISDKITDSEDMLAAKMGFDTRDSKCPISKIKTEQHIVVKLENFHSAGDSDLIERILSGLSQELRLDSIISIRNHITAYNKKKETIVDHPNFIRIIQILGDEYQQDVPLTIQVVLLICSLAKCGTYAMTILNKHSVDEKILRILLQTNHEPLREASLRCFRTLMLWPGVSRTSLIYDDSFCATIDRNQNRNKQTADNQIDTVSSIISYAKETQSLIIQECVADIFAATCHRSKDQALMLKIDATSCIMQLLESRSTRVVIGALGWLTQMCLRNTAISTEIMRTNCSDGQPLSDRLTVFMRKDQTSVLQFLSARCFVHIYRATNIRNEIRITSHVLPALVRMIHRDKPPTLRIVSAECIAYLIENEVSLQNVASICDHLIESLADMLKYDSPSCPEDQVRGDSYESDSQPKLCAMNHLQPSLLNIKTVAIETATTEGPLELGQEMKRASFLALAALASNLEPIRKKVFESCSVMQHLVQALNDSDTKTLKSVLACLLSLSRSVQQLRTSFTENSVYSALKSLLNTTSSDVLILVLAILCNISLDFSPGKQHFLDLTTLNTLCNLTKKSDPILRLHGMWILMNMVYQLKDDCTKFNILRLMKVGHLSNLLDIKDDDEMVMKTLGFLRNMLSHRRHIDAIMCTHGDEIMRSLVKIFKNSSSDRIKEQALCVLTNVADGKESKSLIMKDRFLLTYLTNTMFDGTKPDLRLAAICCITNLAYKEFEGSEQRRGILSTYGIDEKLRALLETSNPILSDRVRTAYNQFR